MIEKHGRGFLRQTPSDKMTLLIMMNDTIMQDTSPLMH
jgi:hypothetical protein